jgi:hypothetical protein
MGAQILLGYLPWRLSSVNGNTCYKLGIHWVQTPHYAYEVRMYTSDDHVLTSDNRFLMCVQASLWLS